MENEIEAARDDEYDRKSLEEKLEYLRQRQKFIVDAIAYIMGKPPTGHQLDWATVEQLKAIVDIARAEKVRREQRNLRRSRLYSYFVRGVISMIGAALLWVAGQVATPVGAFLTKMLPTSWNVGK